MLKLPVIALAALSLIAADMPQNSAIFVSAESGFDSYLIAALKKKKVPVRVVASKEQAEFELQGVAESERPGWARTIFMGQTGTNENASVKLVNLKTGEVLWAYNVHKKNSARSRQSTAEACAKHLKEIVK